MLPESGLSINPIIFNNVVFPLPLLPVITVNGKYDVLLLNKNIERREVDIMIKIEHLTKKYGEGDSCCLALNDVSADIQENTFTVITGKSGSGKTTWKI